MFNRTLEHPEMLLSAWDIPFRATERDAGVPGFPPQSLAGDSWVARLWGWGLTVFGSPQAFLRQGNSILIQGPKQLCPVILLRQDPDRNGQMRLQSS